METRLPEHGTGPSPAAFHYGPGHLIMHGNAAFIEQFGASAVGLPARETLIGLPPEAFDLMDRVFTTGQPLALRMTTRWGERRLVVAPRRDPATLDVYGVTTHLRLIPGDSTG